MNICLSLKLDLFGIWFSFLIMWELRSRPMLCLRPTFLVLDLKELTEKWFLQFYLLLIREYCVSTHFVVTIYLCLVYVVFSIFYVHFIVYIVDRKKHFFCSSCRWVSVCLHILNVLTFLHSVAPLLFFLCTITEPFAELFSTVSRRFLYRVHAHIVYSMYDASALVLHFWNRTLCAEMHCAFCLFWTLLTGDLLHQDGLGEGDRGAAAASIHSHHTDLQSVTGGLVLDNVAAGLLQILIDCFPVLSWNCKSYKMVQFTEMLFILILSNKDCDCKIRWLWELQAERVISNS